MERYDIEKLRSLPCEGVAQRLGLEVKRHKALCPFHDDHTPSMTFKKGKYKCWSCGESGDTISLVQKVLHKPFPDACRWLADEHNVIMTSPLSTPLSLARGAGGEAFCASRYERFFERPWLSDEARRFLFDERRLDPRVVGWCRLTSWRDRQGTPWLQIPYYDREGRLVGVQNRNLAYGSGVNSQLSARPKDACRARTLNSQPNSAPRFRFPTGSACTIYNLPVLNRLRRGDELWICEGASDTWAMLSSGRKAIAIPSATLLGHDQAALLRQVVEQLELRTAMVPDSDVPGERLFMQLQQLLPGLQHHQLPPGCKDFGEYYRRQRARV